jgi:hypothetical protein
MGQGQRLDADDREQCLVRVQSRHQTLTCSDLYVGTDPSGHTAYSWLTTGAVQAVQFDIAPLLQAMMQRNLIDANATLGLIELGSEAFYSTRNVTFTIDDYRVSLNGNPAAPPSAQISTPGQYIEMPASSAVTSTAAHLLKASFGWISVLAIALMSS